MKMQALIVRKIDFHYQQVQKKKHTFCISTIFLLSRSSVSVLDFLHLGSSTLLAAQCEPFRGPSEQGAENAMCGKGELKKSTNNIESEFSPANR